MPLLPAELRQVRRISGVGHVIDVAEDRIIDVFENMSHQILCPWTVGNVGQELRQVDGQINKLAMLRGLCC